MRSSVIELPDIPSEGTPSHHHCTPRRRYEIRASAELSEQSELGDGWSRAEGLGATAAATSVIAY